MTQKNMHAAGRFGNSNHKVTKDESEIMAAKAARTWNYANGPGTRLRVDGRGRFAKSWARVVGARAVVDLVWQHGQRTTVAISEARVG